VVFVGVGVVKKERDRGLKSSCEEDNDLIQTVFTCHGNLDDPDFPRKFSVLLDRLSSMLLTGEFGDRIWVCQL